MPLKELKQKLLIKKHICYSANLFALVSFQLTVQVFLCFAAIGGHFGFSFLCSLLCEHFLISVIANTPYDTISVKQNMPEAEKLTWKASLTDLFSGVILLRVQFFFKLKITCKQPTRTGCVGSVKYLQTAEFCF